jgi:hypothetical protein
MRSCTAFFKMLDMKFLLLLAGLVIAAAGSAQTLYMSQNKIDEHLEDLKASGALDKDSLGLKGEQLDTLAFFPGGKAAFNKVYAKVMGEIFERPNFTRKLPRGKFMIWIRFTVNADGSLSDFLPITQYGYAMEEAHIELYQRSGKWIPATANGVPVASIIKVGHPLNLK